MCQGLRDPTMVFGGSRSRTILLHSSGGVGPSASPAERMAERALRSSAGKPARAGRLVGVLASGPVMSAPARRGCVWIGIGGVLATPPLPHHPYVRVRIRAGSMELSTVGVFQRGRAGESDSGVRRNGLSVRSSGRIRASTLHRRCKRPVTWYSGRMAGFSRFPVPKRPSIVRPFSETVRPLRPMLLLRCAFKGAASRRPFITDSGAQRRTPR